MAGTIVERVTGFISTPAVQWAERVAEISKKGEALVTTEQATVGSCLLGLCAEFAVALYHFLFICLLPFTLLLTLIATPIKGSLVWEALFKVHGTMFAASLSLFALMGRTLYAYCTEVNLVDLITDVPKRFKDLKVYKARNWTTLDDAVSFVGDVWRALLPMRPKNSVFTCTAETVDALKEGSKKMVVSIGGVYKGTFIQLPSQEALLRLILIETDSALDQNLILKVAIPASLKEQLESVWIAPWRELGWQNFAQDYLPNLQTTLRCALSQSIKLEMKRSSYQDQNPENIYICVTHPTGQETQLTGLFGANGELDYPPSLLLQKILDALVPLQISS